MKQLAVLAAVAVAGLIVFNYATTGEFTVVPSFSKSDEERAVRDLRERFTDARRDFERAHRSAGMAGIDTTAEADAARRRVEQVERDLKSLRKRLSEEKAIREAAELAGDLREFARELG